MGVKMTPDSLLIELDIRGITLRRAGDRVMVRDPNRALTPGLKQLIVKHKTALLSRLNVPGDVSQLSLASAMSAPARLQVETWPGDPARDQLVWRLLNDVRCVKFYAADAALCAALDREDAAAVGLAQSRFDRALAEVRALAAELQDAAERIGEGGGALKNTPINSKPS